MAKKKPATRKPATLGRDPNDPRVAMVLAAYDRFMTSPTRDEGFLNIFMNDLLDTSSDAPLFDDWSDEQARALVTAYVLNCPEDRLGVATDEAMRRMVWLDGWELKAVYERLAGKEGASDGMDPTMLGSAVREARRAA